MSHTKSLSKDQIANLILTLAILLGAWLRLTPAAQAGFPINDGGMFYTMIGDLQKSGYTLPAFTTYNLGENIPFAYPPFPLYLAAFLSSLFHLPVTQILLWLPALTSIAVIPAFYSLAKVILNSRQQAAFASLFFAFIPRTFSWFLMGGGLTRSLGQLFLMLTAISAYYLFAERKRLYLIFTVFAGTLVVLSHPEAAIHTVGVVLLIWFFKARSKAAFFDGVIVAFGVGAATALWWLPVLSQHGISSLLNAAQTGNYSVRAWMPLLIFSFTEEPFIGLIAITGLIGLFISMARRNYFFAAWFILPFILEPRSAGWIITMPLAMLAAIALADLLLPALASFDIDSLHQLDQPLQSKAALLFLGYVISYSLLGSYAFALKMGADHLRAPDRRAMDWVARNTPSGSRFIVMTGAQDPMHDPVQEWFPALTERDSKTTLQGKEWTWGAKFIPAIPGYQELQSCFSSNFICVEQQAQKLELSFEYLYIQKQIIMPCSDEETCQYNGKTLVEDLKKSPGYKLVYEGDGAVIFSKTESILP